MKKNAIAAESWGPDRLDVFGLGADGQMLHKFWNGRAWLPTARARDTWQALGGEFTNSPAAASWEPNRLDVFGLGTDGQIYHKAWNGTTWLPSLRGWESLGGVVDSAPAAVSWGANRLDIVGLGTDNKMYHKLWNGSAWLPSFAGWES